MLQWLHDSPAPSRYGEAEAELGATAGVFSNAAFAFRSLAEADTDRRAARAELCASMLVQGEHHVEMFLAITHHDSPG
jgi:hypothetical protein